MGWTALHYAALRGRLSVVRKLMITGGADDTLTDVSYYSATFPLPLSLTSSSLYQLV